MHPELDYLYSTLLRDEREREAEQQRLVSLAGRLSRERRSLRDRVWAARERLGYRLVEVGLRVALRPEPSPLPHR
ncbi:MAG: hypothetical protein ACRD0K_08065 [Egibacteraceae bacterium]